MKKKEKGKKAPAKRKEFQKTAVSVTAVGIAANVLLFALKLVSGIVAHSGAMVSDAVHSASDIFSSIVVIVGVKLSARESDSEHPYGHERFECVAAIVLSVALLLSGVFIGYAAALKLLHREESPLPVPGIPALVAAIVSIAVKEAMYRFTRIWAKRLRSDAMLADAWHHRSDALSSVGALVGIAGARMGLPVLDPIAGLVICLFILKAAYDIFKSAIDKMVDRACDRETRAALLRCAAGQAGVMGIDRLKTREFGNRIYVDIDILADGALTLTEAHAIAQRVHDAVEAQFEEVKHIMVHVNPAPKEK